MSHSGSSTQLSVAISLSIFCLSQRLWKLANAACKQCCQHKTSGLVCQLLPPFAGTHPAISLSPKVQPGEAERSPRLHVVCPLEAFFMQAVLERATKFSVDLHFGHENPGCSSCCESWSWSMQRSRAAKSHTACGPRPSLAPNNMRTKIPKVAIHLLATERAPWAPLRRNTKHICDVEKTWIGQGKLSWSLDECRSRLHGLYNIQRRTPQKLSGFK